ncbi:hypothetical protein [Sutcliffiella horikoshii]|uniref:hypothetical protein n=1 Tax=Sutcliffiella horikoshii TaxID=79883 RepID=UPI00384A5AC2
MAIPKKQGSAIPIQKVNIHESKKGSLFTDNARETIKKYREQNVIFSWKFFDRWHEYFNLGAIGVEWFINCMDTMKEISNMPIKEFQRHTHAPLRVHRHEWDRVSAKYPLPEILLEEIENDTYQFAISRANGRVHGFIIDNLFFIVWLDPQHNMYPMQRHGGLTYCDQPQDCYDCLEIENQKLKEEIRSVEADYYELLARTDNSK